MPRFPVRKIHRAFRELDPFTDEQCERYVALTRRDIGCVYFIVPPLTSIVSFPACIFLVVLISQYVVWSTGSPSNLRIVVTAVCVISFVVGVPLISALLMRDAMLHRMLRRHVRSRIERSRCPACKYSLLGQRVVNDQIRCSECGQTTTLALLGLASADDLIPPIDKPESRNHADHD